MELPSAQSHHHCRRHRYHHRRRRRGSEEGEEEGEDVRFAVIMLQKSQSGVSEGVNERASERRK